LPTVRDYFTQSTDIVLTILVELASAFDLNSPEPNKANIRKRRVVDSYRPTPTDLSPSADVDQKVTDGT
jgi:hypothetical protein